MNIVFEIIKDHESYATFDLEVTEHQSLQSIARKISEQYNIQAMLLPLLNTAIHNGTTIKEYCTIIEKLNSKIHFKIVDRATLSTWETDILSAIAIPSKTESSLDFKRAIPLLSQTLPREILEAFMVRFGDIVNMYGLTAWDQVTESPGRRTLQVHPYAWVRAGASAVVVYKDFRNTDRVLLVYNKRSDKRPHSDPDKLASIPSDWKVPEGHVNPKPCKSRDPERHGMLEVTDEAEESLLLGKNVKKAYTEAPHQLFSMGESMMNAGLREVDEEVGLHFSPSQVQFVHQLDQYQRPMITNIYLMKAGTGIAAPEVKIDDIEIKNFIWAKFDAFQFEQTRGILRIVVPYNHNGKKYPVEVTMPYAILIGLAIQRLREDEIQQASPLFENRKNVEAKVKRILASSKLNPAKKTLLDILGPSPESLLSKYVIPGNDQKEKAESIAALSSFGESSAEYHKKVVALAKLFQRIPEDELLNVQQLLDVISIRVEVESLFYERMDQFGLFSAKDKAATTKPAHAMQMKIKGAASII